MYSLYYIGFNSKFDGILAGASIIVAMGIVDDIKELKPKTKLIFQIIAACVLILFGIKVNYITIPFLPGTGSFYIGWLGIPITILWVVGMTNAVNLIDGLDGLACGVCTISALSLFGVSIISGRITVGILSIILSGACVGFYIITLIQQVYLWEILVHSF
ncbi:MraY family glycosyltransferase [Caloramator sp. mosi_1]|uniref:MraY family glycosyltransferase n=1 Tax=Caloramator sp. mosi_1 TaxID=3023090 RepID=UPI00308168C0